MCATDAPLSAFSEYTRPHILVWSCCLLYFRRAFSECHLVGATTIKCKIVIKENVYLHKQISSCQLSIPAIFIFAWLASALRCKHRWDLDALATTIVDYFLIFLFNAFASMKSFSRESVTRFAAEKPIPWNY